MSSYRKIDVNNLAPFFPFPSLVNMLIRLIFSYPVLKGNVSFGTFVKIWSHSGILYKYLAQSVILGDPRWLAVWLNWISFNFSPCFIMANPLNESVCLIKDLKPGLKNINLVFIVLETGKSVRNVCFLTTKRGLYDCVAVLIFKMFLCSHSLM